MSTQTIDYDALAKQYGASSAPSASAASGPDYDSLAKQYGATSSTPQSQQQQQGAADSMTPGQAYAQPAIGMAKGALDTVNGVSKLINKIPIVGKYLAPQEGIDAVDSLATSSNAAQSVGKGAETIAEFVLGDEALKGASLGDKALKVLKLSQEYEKATPFARAAMEHVMSAARQGAVAGTQETVRSGDVEKGLETGGEVAAGSLAAGAASSAVGKVARGVTDAISGPWTEKAVQKPLQASIRSVFANVADEAEVSPASSNIRNTARAVADAVKDKSKELFSRIDEATDGEFTNVQNKLRNVDMKLRDVAGTDDDAEERLINQQTALRVKLDEAVEAAKRNGVDPDTAESAKGAWRQMSALSDVDREIKLSTFGEGKNAAETVDPKKLVGRLQKLDDSGRLEEALGREQADALLKQAYDSAKASASKATRQKVAIGAAKAAGLGAVGAGTLGHVLSGGNH